MKQLAEERGFRAVLEEAVQGGQVDVGLHRDDFSIACEISVSSTPEYEAQNLAKCLGAGFTRVWAIAPDAKRKRVVQQRARERLGSDSAKVEFFLPADLVQAFKAYTPPAPEERVVGGYKVKSTRSAMSPEEAKRRREELARILSSGKRQGRS